MFGPSTLALRAWLGTANPRLAHLSSVLCADYGHLAQPRSRPPATQLHRAYRWLECDRCRRQALVTACSFEGSAPARARCSGGPRHRGAASGCGFSPPLRCGTSVRSTKRIFVPLSPMVQFDRAGTGPGKRERCFEREPTARGDGQSEALGSLARCRHHAGLAQSATSAGTDPRPGLFASSRRVPRLSTPGRGRRARCHPGRDGAANHRSRHVVCR